MAALSEADLKLILGDAYKDGDLTSIDPAQMKINADRVFKAKVDKLDNAKFSAVALVLLGLVLLVSNQMAISGPTIMLVSVAGVAMGLIGAAWYFYSRNALAKLQGAQPAGA